MLKYLHLKVIKVFANFFAVIADFRRTFKILN